VFCNIEYEYSYEERLRDEIAKAVLIAFINRNGIDVINSIGICYNMADKMLASRRRMEENEQYTSTSSSI